VTETDRRVRGDGTIGPAPTVPPPPADESPLDALLGNTGSDSDTPPVFPVGFRGYDRDAVDEAVRTLADRVRRLTVDAHEERERADATIARMRTEFERQGEETVRGYADEVAALNDQLRAASARVADAETRVSALSEKFVAQADADPGQERQQFEAILRVAEEQAAVLVQNAVAQADRLLVSAQDEAAALREEAVAEQARLRTEAQHDADQVRLRIETEATAHDARLERERAHAAEKVAQAEREATAIRTESEKGAAALRSLVSRETGDLRAKAEHDVREMTARVLEFEESLTRRQDEAQQEFMVLHDQAVAHAERITSDASDQVASALEHARRIGARADDFERLSRAQAQQIEADAQVRARAALDTARDRAAHIAARITDHSTQALRDAEDRARDLRWQQQQLASFMAELSELLRAVPRELDESGTLAEPESASAEDAPAPLDDTGRVNPETAADSRAEHDHESDADPFPPEPPAAH
jgi:hypothetical protein